MTKRAVLLVENGVAEVRLNRPDKLNALDVGMFRELAAVAEQLAGDPQIRCIVLSGEGRSFCAGIDLEVLTSAPELQNLTQRTHGDANLFQIAAIAWHQMPVPVIAALHGHVLGAGFQIMLGADLRIAAPDTQLSLMEMRWGLVPDLGGIALLRGLVRDDVAREIVLTGKRISGTEAASLGLVTRTADDPRAEALALARSIAGSSPDAVRAAKRLLNLPAATSLRDVLIAEAREQEAMLASDNHREALRAHLEQRQPQFRDISS